MDQMQQEKGLTVVQAWVVPFLFVGERIVAPFRLATVRIAGYCARAYRYVSASTALTARSAVLRAKALKTRLGRRVTFMPHAVHEHLRTSVIRLEEQALLIAAHLDDAEKRLKACLGIARTLHGLGRPTGTALARAIDALAEQEFWTSSKSKRPEAATHYACAITELAATSGEHKIAFDAYTLAQQYGAMLDGHFLKIRFAIMMSDIAGYVIPCDPPTWLGRALEIAIAIRDRASRMRAVSAVAAKMVSVGVAPPMGYTWDTLLRPAEGFDDYAVGGDDPQVEGAAPSDEDIDAAFGEHAA